VTAYPDVTVHELTADDEFLVIACDGMFCSISNAIERVCESQMLTNPLFLQVSGIASPPKLW
jgi:serine/threonine protein phosphatase PrpC